MRMQRTALHKDKPISRPTAPAPPSPLARAGIGVPPGTGVPSGGQALDRKTEREMSARFGHDFSRVRIHSDARAAASAEALGANAYALGGDIVFSAGKYQPGSRETERLLAHELTHVAQQDRFGSGAWGRQSRRGDASEREADAAAGAVAAGRDVRVSAAPDAALARDAKGDQPQGDEQSRLAALRANPMLAPLVDFATPAPVDPWAAAQSPTPPAAPPERSWLQEQFSVGYPMMKAARSTIQKDENDFDNIVDNWEGRDKNPFSDTQIAGGAIKEMGGMVYGLGGMIADPVDTVMGLGSMAAHTPVVEDLPELEMFRAGKRTPQPDNLYAEDAQYWKKLWHASPYGKDVDEGRYGDLAGRGAAALTSLLSAAVPFGEFGEAGVLSELTSNFARVAEVADETALGAGEALDAAGVAADTAKPLPGGGCDALSPAGFTDQDINGLVNGLDTGAASSGNTAGGGGISGGTTEPSGGGPVGGGRDPFDIAGMIQDEVGKGDPLGTPNSCPLDPDDFAGPQQMDLPGVDTTPRVAPATATPDVTLPMRSPNDPLPGPNDPGYMTRHRLQEARGDDQVSEHVIPGAQSQAISTPPGGGDPIYKSQTGRHYQNDFTTRVDEEVATDKTHAGQTGDNARTRGIKDKIARGEPVNIIDDLFLPSVENFRRALGNVPGTANRLVDGVEGAMGQMGHQFDMGAGEGSYRVPSLLRDRNAELAGVGDKVSTTDPAGAAGYDDFDWDGTFGQSRAPGTQGTPPGFEPPAPGADAGEQLYLPGLDPTSQPLLGQLPSFEGPDGPDTCSLPDPDFDD